MKTTPLLVCALTALCSVLYAGTPDKAPFIVTTKNAEVNEMTASSIQLKSEHFSYLIKLQPNKVGNVAFSLSGIGYSATEKVRDLAFQVKITGYSGEREVYPAFSVNAENEEIVARENFVRFRRIKESIPVWFNESVDSIKLEYSNSHSINVHQYIWIHDLQILHDIKVVKNPVFTPCRENKIMIAIDGSSSIDRKERKTMSKEFVRLVKDAEHSPDTNTFAILEYRTGVIASITSTDSKELIQAITNYKKGKNRDKAVSDWSNWSVAFDEAIQERPELFIFITDGWSNWQEGEASSFTSVFGHLIEKSNLIKENGTRILFITADMNPAEGATSILHNFLGKDNTYVENETSLDSGSDLTHVDLIHLESLSSMRQVPLHTLIACPVSVETVAIASEKAE